MLKKILFVVFACVSIIGVTSGANALTVSYDCGTSNGTAPTDSTNYNSGDVVTVKPNTCTVPSGKHFAGYICGSTNVAAGNTFTISSNTTCTAQWENGKFAVKTTSTTTVLNFSMTAVGTFTVDCGDNGTLSSSANPTDVSGGTITRTTTGKTTYTCTWANAGAHTITFDGTGTGYSTDDKTAAITFFVDDNSTNSNKIASITGSLYNLFPPTGTANGQIPRFSQTFSSSAYLKSIPSTLFDGYTVGSTFMFWHTFKSCLTLHSIPNDLFASFTTAADSMFHSTFYMCHNITSIPHDLFANFTTFAGYMFDSTFASTGLTSIPHDLFSNIQNGETYMFGYTFSGCNGLTSIPNDLFVSIKTGASQMFYRTFSGCHGLTSIPDDLFSSITTSGTYMFWNTFINCTGLTTLPSDLFSSFTNGAHYMFRGTFQGCTALTTIPNGLFASFTSGGAYMFYETFAGCNHLTTVPADLFENIHIGQQYMFDSTFQGCSALTSIPSGLFSHFTTGAPHLFHATFSACSSLSALPSGLFSGFTSGADYMFYYTFNVCSGLRGYVPADFFGGLIANNAAYQTDMMTYVFYGTDLATSCDSYNGMVRYVTPYDEYWSSKVSCGAPINCTAGQYLPARTTTCATCTANNYCPSGSYGINIVDQGLTACSSVGDNSYTISDAGATADTQCYKTCTIAHATTVTGNDYYGAGVDTCVATACEDGYSVSSDICTGNIITINWNGATAAAIAANNAGTAIYGGDIRTPQSIDPSQIPAGKHFVGWKFRKTPQG